MAVKRVRALINASEFPMLYEQAGRSVIDNQDLAPRMPGTFYGSRENAEFGVPQLIYGENILPIAKGLMAVGTGQQAAAISPAVTNLDSAIVLRDATENQTLFVPSKGANRLYDATAGTWSTSNSFAFLNELISRAYVAGRTFVCYEKTKIVELVGGVMTTVALTYPAGYSIANIRGIGAASNYLLLFTDLEILWCSPLNLLDFADIEHGAGGQIPIDVKGRITAILPISGGAICYTARNAVAITYTQDSSRPFVFKEVQNSGGVVNSERVTGDTNDAGQFAWTTNGIQKVTLNAAQTLFPQVTDFLTGKRLELWNSTTKAVEGSDIGNAFSVKLNYLAGRYLCISYGQGRNDFDEVLVYDASLDRWGKLRFNHCDMFMYPYPATAGDYTYDQLPGFYDDIGEDTYDDLSTVRTLSQPPKRGIAFLRNNGEIHILATDFAQTTAHGVAIFGHMQSDRNANITMQSIELEGVKDSPTPQVRLLGSVNGYDRDDVVTPELVQDTDRYKQYDCRFTAENMDVVIEGSFVLTGMILNMTRHGYR